MTKREEIRIWACRLKTQVHMLVQACRDPRTPWYVRGFAFLVVSYALSPIDLIPDFIPVLGYLDDTVLIPLGLYLVLRCIPEPVLNEARAKVDTDQENEQKLGLMAAAVILLIWAATTIFVIRYLIF